jgi:hypothetical protein
MLVSTRHVGTGHLSVGQSAGRVVRVTVGHGVMMRELVVLGGSVTMLVTMPVCVDVDVAVVRREVVLVVVGLGGQRRVVVLDEVVGQGKAEVWKAMSHPW